ncbi:GH1 family beta-glucosidase [Glycomyces sp. L485]|uniref:GH1 family beta-glucosidase n=1 Tax=Glycomyces sp. L485 TaxID=2909235 RepID=UPI001F4B0952|nr:GH1 family beta-glucosidase [Glycomyces sp. L485]MCH7231842.1 GH1 family beta-glucosidase [Glycomyces sp. L485]
MSNDFEVAALAARFPSGFAWGAATSSYQVEGSTTADGRGQSIWDTFVSEPGRVVDGSNGDKAIDSYHNIEGDVALVGELGLNSYRFSLSWPRICPDGDGKVNRAGLDYYSALVDALLEQGITPWVTLYHWDLPQALENGGGWPKRDTAERFGEFAQIAHQALGDRVKRWITVNEPWCAAFLGYSSGEHAPGRREPAASIAAAHHLMLGHGLAARAIKEAEPDATVSIGLNFYPVYAASDAPVDVDAARRIDGVQNRWFTDAALKGAYPEDIVDDFTAVTDFSFVEVGDMEVINAPLDCLSVNYYSQYTVTGREGGAVSASAAPTGAGSPWPANEHVGFMTTGLPQTDMGWEIAPEGLSETLRRLHANYPDVTLAVTENGAAFPDKLVEDQVADSERLDYVREHLGACADAVEAGVPLIGYFAWSLADNFEWAWGYTKRFGLVYVDFETGQRVVKDSGKWYCDLVRTARSNGEAK